MITDDFNHFMVQDRHSHYHCKKMSLASETPPAETQSRAANGSLTVQDAVPRAEQVIPHLLVYNLIRRVMAVAAADAKIPPWQISSKGTLQTLINVLPWLVSSM